MLPELWQPCNKNLYRFQLSLAIDIFYICLNPRARLEVPRADGFFQLNLICVLIRNSCCWSGVGFLAEIVKEDKDEIFNMETWAAIFQLKLKLLKLSAVQNKA